MTGEYSLARPDGRGGTGPAWLRFGCLLAVGEVVIVALIFVDTGKPAGHLGMSVGHVQHTTMEVRNPPTPPVAPPTTVPATPSSPTTAVPTPSPPQTPDSPVRSVTAPATLAANIVAQPNFLQSCAGAQYDDSPGCVGATLQAIANARRQEGLPPMTLPSNWTQLSPEQQIFVSTNLERTARGLPPMTAMSAVLDHAARQGAGQSIDPSPPGGLLFWQWGSNWAGAVGNPLEAVYFWMYDDGPSSANIDCSASKPRGCWGHRANILLMLPCHMCLMGTGWDAGGYSGDPSMTELLVETSGNPQLEFTWQQESPYLS
jgi:hypothetical protein